jgi:hypothetical protein
MSGMWDSAFYFSFVKREFNGSNDGKCALLLWSPGIDFLFRAVAHSQASEKIHAFCFEIIRSMDLDFTSYNCAFYYISQYSIKLNT